MKMSRKQKSDLKNLKAPRGQSPAMRFCREFIRHIAIEEQKQGRPMTNARRLILEKVPDLAAEIDRVRGVGQVEKTLKSWMATSTFASPRLAPIDPVAFAQGKTRRASHSSKSARSFSGWKEEIVLPMIKDAFGKNTLTVGEIEDEMLSRGYTPQADDDCQNRTRSVYVFSSAVDEHKIGTAFNVQRRFNDLNGHGVALTRVLELVFAKPNEANRVEEAVKLALHGKMIVRGNRTEWFRISAADMREEILKACRELGVAPIREG